MTTEELRKSILQLAIQGKLVEQNPDDEPASVLLERIRAEKERLIKDKKIKRDKNESVIYRADNGSFLERIGKEVRCIDDEIPFEIPDSWEWVRLGELALYRKGPFGSSLTKDMFVPADNDSIKVYEQKNAIQKDFSLGQYFISRDKFESMQGFIVEANDIIVSCAGTIGETYVLPTNAPTGIINQALMRVRLFNREVEAFWLLYFDYILKKEAQLKSQGSAIKNIPPFDILKMMLIPLPPLAEQQRIVDKLNDLEPLLADYERLELQESKLEKNFSGDLNKSILQYAIQGKLVAQNPADEPASVLLDRIRAEKERLIKEKKIKRDKNESVIYRGDNGSFLERIGKEVRCIDDEIPFEIPDSWEWCRLGSIIHLLSGRDLLPSEYNNNGNGFPYITGASNIINEEIVVNRWTVMPLVISKKGDLLITCKGTIGTMAINTIGDIHIARQIMSIKPYFSSVFYVKGFLKSYVPVLLSNAKSMIPGISREHIAGSLFPLPPLAEQKRIVEKLEQIKNTIKI